MLSIRRKGNIYHPIIRASLLASNFLTSLDVPYLCKQSNSLSHLSNTTQSQWVYSTFNDPSSNPAMAIPPSADSAQDRAQGVRGTSNEFIKMAPDNVFHTYVHEENHINQSRQLNYTRFDCYSSRTKFVVIPHKIYQVWLPHLIWGPFISWCASNSPLSCELHSSLLL